MLPNELNYLVSLEQHQDHLRALERRQLIKMVEGQRPSDRAMPRRIAAWLGGQMVRWGLALQQYGPQPQRHSNAAVVRGR